VNEHEVDRILARLGQEEFVPPPDLVERTRRRLHRNFMLPVLIATSLGLQLVAFGVFQIYLFSTQASTLVRLLGQVGLTGTAIMLIGGILIARKQVLAVLCRLETVAGCR
jgi:hypothetical protein